MESDVNWMEDAMGLAKFAMRTVIGGLFVGHGLQKLQGRFNGPGLEGTEAMMESLEMRPARRNALAAGVTETAGGAMLAAGLATPLASSALIGVMLTAIRKVHAPNGVWNANGGWEFNAVMIAALYALAEDGPGKMSLDHALGQNRTQKRRGLAALALGVATSTAAIEMGRRSA